MKTLVAARQSAANKVAGTLRVPSRLRHTECAYYDHRPRASQLARTLTLGITAMLLLVANHANRGFANPPCNAVHNQAVAVTPTGTPVNTFGTPVNTFGTPVNVLLVTEFAVPVAVPVAAAAPYSYGYASNAGFDATGIVNELRALRAELSQSRSSNLSSTNVAAKPSLVRQNCASCHGGAEPKAGLSLDNLAALDDATRLKAAAAVLSDRMPKGGKLDADTAGKLLLELTAKPSAAAKPPPAKNSE